MGIFPGMDATLQNILQQRFKTYAQQHPQPLHKHKGVTGQSYFKKSKGSGLLLFHSCSHNPPQGR